MFKLFKKLQMLKRIILIFIVFLIIIPKVSSQQLMIPYNFDFEIGAIGYDAPYWQGSSRAMEKGYIFVTTDSMSTNGKKSLLIASPDEKDTTYKAVIKQSIYAAPYLGKKYKFSADVHFAPDIRESFGIIWCNIRDANDNIIASFYTPDKQIIKESWNNYFIDIEVPQNAVSISYGFAIKGSGVMFVDNVKLESMQNDAQFYAPPKKLSDLQVTNILSFAEIYGLMKYFYPSFYSQNLDWERILIEGIYQAETARSIEDFTKNIANFIAPICPISSLNSSGKADFSAPTEANSRPYTWLHSGIPSDYPTAVSNSKMINLAESQRSFAGIALMNKAIDVRDMQGQKYFVNIKSNIDKYDDFSFGNMLIRFENTSGEIIGSGSIDEPFVVDSEPAIYTIEGEVPSNAVYMKFAQNLYGEGSLYIDEISLKFRDKQNIEKTSVIEEFDVQDKNFRLDEHWSLLAASKSAGYQYHTGKNPATNANSIILEATAEKKLPLPNRNNIVKLQLANGLYFSVPTVLFIDSVSNSQLPIDIDLSKSGKPINFEANSLDRHTRIATAIELWNLLFHFYPNANNLLTIDSLSDIIKNISAQGGDDFLTQQLGRMLIPLGDNHSIIEKVKSESSYAIPAILKWLDNSLYAVKSLPNSPLLAGDKIIEIDGTPTVKYLEKIEKSVSASNSDWKRLTSIAKVANGDYGSKVSFKIERNGKSSQIELARTCTAGEILEERPNRMELIQDSIVYCDMTRTNDNEIKEYLKYFEQSRAIIFDLRGESAVSEYLLGLLAKDSLISLPYILELNLLPQHKLSSKVDLSSTIKIINSLQDKKIIFLQDERTSGLSETILAIAKANNIAKSFGRSTSGAAGEIASARLSGGYYFIATAVNIYSPSGENITKNRIQPDHYIENSLQQYIDGYDAILQRAIEFVTFGN